MESTQNKIYEIEESAQFDQKIKSTIDDNNQIDEKNEEDFNYGDQFEENTTSNNVN